jgi:hypothetical protein
MNASLPTKWKKRAVLCYRLWIAAAPGLVSFITAYILNEFMYDNWVMKFFIVAGMVLFLPATCYTYVLLIWHWKDRYQGKHPDLWGAIILIETSGWMKLVYIFRHLIPDFCGTGRYGQKAEAPVLPANIEYTEQADTTNL